MRNIINNNINTDSQSGMITNEEDAVAVHPVVYLMSVMMNYLSVSFYESQFTYNDERSRAIINNIYDDVSKTSNISPSQENIRDFYQNVKLLRNVTDTDDPVYGSCMYGLKKYIINV